MRLEVLVIVCLILCACQTLAGPDIVATVQAENNAIATESSDIRKTLQSRGSEMRVTVHAIETSVAQIGRVNQQLLATVQAGNAPTPGLTRGIVADAVAFNDESGVSSVQLTQAGTASQIREADGCAMSVQTQFPQDTPRIYATVHVLNVREAMTIGVDWWYEGQLLLEENWIVPYDDTDLCVWFFIEPSMVTFLPGRWAARLFVEEASIEAEATFLIVEAMSDG